MHIRELHVRALSRSVSLIRSPRLHMSTSVSFRKIGKRNLRRTYSVFPFTIGKLLQYVWPPPRGRISFYMRNVSLYATIRHYVTIDMIVVLLRSKTWLMKRAAAHHYILTFRKNANSTWTSIWYREELSFPRNLSCSGRTSTVALLNSFSRRRAKKKKRKKKLREEEPNGEKTNNVSWKTCCTFQ